MCQIEPIRAIQGSHIKTGAARNDRYTMAGNANKASLDSRGVLESTEHLFAFADKMI